MEQEFIKAQCDIEHFIFTKSRDIKRQLRLPYTYEDELLDEIDYAHKVNCQWLVDLNKEHLSKWRIHRRNYDAEIKYLVMKQMILERKSVVQLTEPRIINL